MPTFVYFGWIFMIYNMCEALIKKHVVLRLHWMMCISEWIVLCIYVIRKVNVYGCTLSNLMYVNYFEYLWNTCYGIIFKACCECCVFQVCFQQVRPEQGRAVPSHWRAPVPWSALEHWQSPMTGERQCPSHKKKISMLHCLIIHLIVWMWCMLSMKVHGMYLYYWKKY